MDEEVQELSFDEEQGDDQNDQYFDESMIHQTQKNKRWTKGQFADDFDDRVDEESERDKQEDHKSEDSDFEIIGGYGQGRKAEKEKELFDFPAQIYPTIVTVGEIRHKTRLDQILD